MLWFRVMKVGIVGLGLLGHAVASRLLTAGHEVVGYDVVPARNDALKTLGGQPVASAPAVAAASDGVCTILPSLAAVEEAILGADGVLSALGPGRTVLQMSTISPSLSERLAREVTAKGVEFLDCPVSGTSAMVAQGNGVFYGGGERAVFERWKPVLESVLARAVYVGRAGQAMALKLVANLLVGLHSAAAAEALTMARRCGLDTGVALDVLAGGAAGSRMIEVRGPMIVRDEFPAQMKLELFMKDLHLIQEAAAAAGAPTPLTDVAERLYAAVSAAGHGAEDLAVVARAFLPLR